MFSKGDLVRDLGPIRGVNNSVDPEMCVKNGSGQELHKMSYEYLRNKKKTEMVSDMSS